MYCTRWAMWQRLLLLLAMLVHGGTSAVSGQSAMPGIEEKYHVSRLSEYTDLLCPYNVICREGEPMIEPPGAGTTRRQPIGTRTTRGQPIAEPERVGCCTDCSCSEDCGLTENCCFPKLDKHHLVDRTRQECIYTATDEPDYAIIGYHMVVDSFPNGSGEFCGSEDTPCGDDENATALGSLFPVFSKKTGRIYKNSKCAQCHGLDEADMVQWEAILVCDSLRYSDVSTFFQFLDSSISQTMDPICHLRFFYPGPISDMEREKCYPGTEAKCTSGFDFPLIEGLNMSRQEIRNACSSSFHSPVLSNKWFKNVFCAVCKDLINKYNPRYLCTQKQDFDVDKALLDVPLTALIGADKLKSLSRPNTRYDQHVPEPRSRNDEQFACKVSKDNVTDCRLVHCPSGQVRLSNGECGYPVKYWDMASTDLYIKLFPKQDLNLSAISHIDFDSMLGNKSLSVSPWSKFWQVDSLMYTNKTRMDNNVSIIDYFLVRMEYGKKRIILNSFMRNVEQSMNEEWILHLDESTVRLRQEFSEFTEIGRFRNAGEPLINIPGIPTPSFAQNLSLPTFYYLSNPFYQDAGMSLTKMFFCEQILLKPDEYEYSNKIRMLRLTTTGQFFFSGEISVAYDAVLGYVPKLCLHDAGFTRPSSQSHSGSTGFNTKYLASFIVSLVLIVMSH